MNKIVTQAQALVDGFISEQTGFGKSSGERGELKLSRDEAEAIVWEEGDEDYEIILDEPDDHSRWEVWYKCIARRKSDNTYWDFGYSKGATESQHKTPFEFDGDTITIPQVFPQLKVKVTYI